MKGALAHFLTLVLRNSGGTGYNFPLVDDRSHDPLDDHTHFVHLRVLYPSRLAERLLPGYGWRWQRLTG